MRCEEAREFLEELKVQELPAHLREHLSVCAQCAEYARGWPLVRAGFEALAAEPAPEPSLGFATRLLRRLGETAEELCSREGALERAGRRMVYIALLATLTVLLALVLPSSGPFRETAAQDLYLAQADFSAAGQDPVFAPDSRESIAASPESSAPRTTKGKK